MSRIYQLTSLAAIWLSAFLVNSSEAQQAAPFPQSVQLTGGIQPELLPPQNNSTPARQVSAQGMVAQPHMMKGFPQTGAALYPSPQPYIPYQVGGTLHTNQAFYPHEYLYPHCYKAMYAPFYYEVRGNWFMTPWGVRNSETWKLTGTMVDVKYRSKFAPFSGFKPNRR